MTRAKLRGRDCLIWHISARPAMPHAQSTIVQGVPPLWVFFGVPSTITNGIPKAFLCLRANSPSYGCSKSGIYRYCGNFLVTGLRGKSCCHLLFFSHVGDQDAQVLLHVLQIDAALGVGLLAVPPALALFGWTVMWILLMCLGGATSCRFIQTPEEEAESEVEEEETPGPSFVLIYPTTRVPPTL